MTWEFTLYGKVPSKKNRYMPRKDRPGMIKDSALRTELDRLGMQIPGELRDLKLTHPDIAIQMVVCDGRSDRDSALTTILDLLVQYGVIANDSIAKCNGLLRVPPAVKGEDWQTKVTIRDWCGEHSGFGWPI